MPFLRASKPTRDRLTNANRGTADFDAVPNVDANVVRALGLFLRTFSRSGN